MTSDAEKIAEWRARALESGIDWRFRDERSARKYRIMDPPTGRLRRTIIDAIAQADAKNHLGYFDTRTEVAVPREPTMAMLEAGFEGLKFWIGKDKREELIRGDKDFHPEVDAGLVRAYRAMLKASENEGGGPHDG